MLANMKWDIFRVPLSDKELEAIITAGEGKLASFFGCPMQSGQLLNQIYLKNKNGLLRVPICVYVLSVCVHACPCVHTYIYMYEFIAMIVRKRG